MDRSAFFTQETQQALESNPHTDYAVLFAKLYDKYAAVMLGVITKIIPDQERAVDLLEIAFGYVGRQMDQLRTAKQPLFVSLLQIVRRVAVESLQESRKAIPFPGQLIRNEPLIAPTPSIAEGLDKQQAHSADAQRKTLVDVVLFKNCTPEEAAAQVGIPVQQVREQLRLAFQQVRTPTN